MSTPASSLTVDTSTFKIFFLCEDSLSLDRATALKETLAENCQDQVEIEAHFCEYARLCHPRLRDNATAHVADADMIVLSARGSDGLPAFVQTWMNELGHRCPDKTVCAEFLHTDSSDRAGGFHRFMNTWAAQKGILLFSNLFPSCHLGELKGAAA
jgi:hypothetical protein